MEIDSHIMELVHPDEIEEVYNKVVAVHGTTGLIYRLCYEVVDLAVQRTLSGERYSPEPKPRPEPEKPRPVLRLVK